MAHIIYAKEADSDVKRLLDAWLNPETFVLLPERPGVSREWVDNAVRGLPEDARERHFGLLSSGSTGQPKLIVGSRERAEALARVINDFQELDAARETVLALPLSYCYAFVNQWLWSVVFNRRLVRARGFSAPNLFLDALVNSRDGMLCLTASQVPLFYKYFKDKAVFPGIIRLNFAGAPFPQKDMDRIHGIFPSARIFNNYGCAEAMPRLTARSERAGLEGNNVGRPLPGVRLKRDEQGRILFISRYSAVGFYDDEGYKPIKEGEWTASGDYGEEIEGGYWRVNGRADDVFKRFGEKVSMPQLLDTVRSSWSGEAVFYREKDDNGEDGCVLVVSPEPSEKEYRDILSVFRKNHTRAQWPIRLESVDSFPFLGNGKIDRSALVKRRDKAVHWHQRF
ncbi:MAG: class I adenylate-forming enzyme family protein [Candidatus Omnitrophota bacterium]